MPFDRLDVSILQKLLGEGRITSLDLGREVGLSATACARRVQQLEACGVIQGYQARVALDRLGFPATVMVTITLERQSEDMLEAFETALAKCPSVLWACLMSGSSDYVACLAARDIGDYEQIHKQQLSRLPGVARLQSSFMLREIVRRPAPADMAAQVLKLPG